MKRASQWSNTSKSTYQTRQSTRSSRFSLNPAAIYDDLLEEALRRPSPAHNRPLKKRKSQRNPTEVITIENTSSEQENGITEDKDIVVIDSTDGESVDQDDMEWDEVELTAVPISEQRLQSEAEPRVKEFALQSTPQKST